MKKCELCERKSTYKEIMPVKKGAYERNLEYCNIHRKIGLDFGFLVEEELIEIK